ncbi:MAG: hypothetical protein HKN40_13495, partial [Winogradskyella sp.]|nr:hypothetical protein [Winogradskyella sp.]
MKSLLLIAAIIVSHVCFSQEKQKAVSKDSLGLSFTINTMTKTTCHGVEVFLKRVVVDSRCPKDVMCVRAGEAKVIVSVFKDGKHLEDKLIEVYPSR